MDEYRSRELFGYPAAALAAERIVVDSTVPEHTHDFVELAFVVTGEGTHRSAAGDHRIQRGSVAIIRPGAWHSLACARPMTVFNLYLAPEVFHRELVWLLDYPDVAAGLLRGGAPPMNLRPEALDRVEEWLGQLAALGPGHSVPTLLGLATSAIGELVGAESSPSTTRAGEMAPFVREATVLLSGRIAHGWTVGEIASRVSVSPSHLSRRFREQVGVPPLRWLDQLRGERAAALLLRTGLSVAEVGRRVGWSDPNYASRRFRSLYAWQPTEYRRRFRTTLTPYRLTADQVEDDS